MFRTIADSPVDVTVVHPDASSSLLAPPLTGARMADLLRSVMNNAVLRHAIGYSDISQLVSSFLPREDMVEMEGEPHCECVLLRHHHFDNTGATPYPYIGTSKLSCFTCALYFQVYNDYATEHGSSGLIKFRTRGSFGGVALARSPGSLASTRSPDIDAYMGERMVDKVGIILRAVIQHELDHFSIPSHSVASLEGPGP